MMWIPETGLRPLTEGLVRAVFLQDVRMMGIPETGLRLDVAYA
jgi:hypothetical protein